MGRVLWLGAAAARDGAVASGEVGYEADLARLWQSGGLGRGPFTLSNGARVELVYPGRRNWDAGPDFVDAILATPRAELLRGGVELHRRAGDWRVHGHERDPRYNCVVLQVVFHDDGTPARRHDGLVVPTLAAGRCAAPRVVPSPVWLETPCARWRGRPQALLPRVNEAGSRRFSARVSALAREVDATGSEEALYRAVMEALGYSQNSAPMRLLAVRLPLAHLEETIQSGCSVSERAFRASSLLLSASGLPGYSGRVGELAMPPLVPPRQWRLLRLRPANQPARRLAGLALALAELYPLSLAGAVRSAAESVLPVALPRALRNLFCRPNAEGGVRLIGAARAADIVVNSVLPWLAAQGRTGRAPELSATAWHAYRVHPCLSDNYVLREMRSLLALPRAAFPGALAQQGLLHIFEACCRERRCGECPLRR